MDAETWDMLDIGQGTTMVSRRVSYTAGVDSTGYHIVCAASRLGLLLRDALLRLRERGDEVLLDRLREPCMSICWSWLGLYSHIRQCLPLSLPFR